MANRFWVGGSAAWDATVGTKWALTSGGAGGQAVPLATDDVFFDATSGAVTITQSGAQVCKSLTCTGFTGTFAGSGGLTISGSCTAAAGMTWSNTGGITFNATATVTQNGKTFFGITVNGAGITVTPSGAISLTGSLFLTQGTWAANTNNPAHTLGALNFTGASTRVLSMGSGLWTLTGIASVWTISGSGMTLNKNTANIKITDATAVAKTFTGGAQTYNDVWFAGEGSFNVNDANTFGDLKVDGGNVEVLFAAGVTFTVSSLTINGASGASTLLKSSTLGTIATISDASGTDTLTWCAIRDLTFSGGATFAATSSYDMGNNSGITITGIGGGGNAKQVSAFAA